MNRLKRPFPQLLVLTLILLQSFASMAQQAATWTDITGITVSGSTLTKTAVNNDGNAEAGSEDFLPPTTNGWVTSTVLEMGTDRTFGLSENYDETGYQSIDFAINMASWQNALVIYENGVSKLYLPNGYQVSDVFKIERFDNKILYKKNDQLIYTSTVTSISALRADVSIYTTGSTLGNITISDSFIDPTEAGSYVPIPHLVTWTDVLGIEFLNQHIRKDEVTAEGNAGAISIDYLPIGTDGFVQSEVMEMGTARTFGLSETNDDADFATIDFAIHTSYWYDQLAVYENGTNKFTLNNGYAIGDILSVERLNDQILYKKNGTVFYTSTLTSISELKADVSLYTQNSTLGELTISDSFIDPNEAGNVGTTPHSITWTDILGIEFLGEHIRKTAESLGGNAGAISVDYLPAGTDGWVESTVLEMGTARTFGLSEINEDANYATIDFGIHISYWNDELAVYENGTKAFGLNNGYAIGDILSVERLDNQILYKKNGTVFHTSSLTSISDLRADISLYTQNSTLGNVKISDSFSNPNSPNPGGTSLWSQNGNTAYYLENVAIGRDAAQGDHMLSVEGKIVVQGVKVTLDGWADYVFEKDYKLMSLADVKKYIDKHGHLPEIPNTEKVIKEGIYLGEMNKKLLQKIEELTLYLIEQNDKIERLEKRIDKKNN